MVYGQAMGVFTIRGHVCICVVFLSKCVFVLEVCSWCINLGMSVFVFQCVYMCAHTELCTCILVYLPAPSLGRRQSQCWGCSSAAPVASLANLGGESLQSWPVRLRVPGGRQCSPAIYIGFIPFPSVGPKHPAERKSQLHSLCPLRQYVMIHTGLHIMV